MASKIQKSPSQTSIDLGPIIKPNYRTMDTPTVAVGANGDQKGELDGPRGVAYREDTREIFVVDEKNSRIQIFNGDGAWIHEFGEEELDTPSSLLVLEGFLYVTDWGWLGTSLFKYDLTNLKVKKRSGKNNFDPEKCYNLLRQPFAGDDGRIYIPDNNNNRICIFSKQLERTEVIKLRGVRSPIGINVYNDQLYILSNVGKFCVHVLTLGGDIIESVITRGEFRSKMQVQFPSYFLIDPHRNIVVSDFGDHIIKVFSPNGKSLLYRVGEYGHHMGELVHPMGILITRGGDLIVVSENTNYGLQVFGTLY